MKLHDIEKKNIFEVPDGYFDKLPQLIQARVAAKEKTVFSLPAFVFNFKYAFAIVLVAVVSVIVFRNYTIQPMPVGMALQEINTETLIAYLGESDITEEEIIEAVDAKQLDFNDTPAASIYGLDIKTTDIDKLSNDIENEYF